MVHIKVAVRIRPLSQKEIGQKDEIIVKKGDKSSILVTNPKVPENQNGDSRLRTHRFAVDYCYDPLYPESCTQEAVYQEVGVEVLDSMFDGYNACIFAYGHSASGKTYTMMGEPEAPGLTPRICNGLFEKMREKAENAKVQFNIVISFLEIYNERVRDLLVSDDTGQAAGNFSLRVREHPKLGPYVQDLTQHVIEEEEKLLELLNLGNSRRSTAATENNVHSSRSHAVFTIRLKQSDEDNFETDKSSKVHLVDLAGSLQENPQVKPKKGERATSVQSRTRLKEGANINKSLVTLGNVISALAESCESAKEHSSSKTWQPFVPYRDSVLTWLLKDTLGGNSNTIMIATVSPGSSCLTETISTLRYAKRTKRIVNQPIINEDPKVRTIRELRDEVSKLKNMILSLQILRPDLEPITDISLLDASAIEELINSCNFSKWVDTAGNEITNKDNDLENGDQETFQKSTAGEDEKPSLTDSIEQSEAVNNNVGISSKNDKTKKGTIRNLDILGTIKDEESNAEIQKSTPRIIIETPSSSSLAGRGVSKINDEKKTDVNGLVIDRLPHESQVFSDSLESFSFLRRKSFTQSDYDLSELDNSEIDKRNYSLNSLTDSESVDTNFLKNSQHESLPKLSKPAKLNSNSKKELNRKVKHSLKRQFSSCENLSKSDLAKMLHRSRPDLIKGISTRSQDGLPSTSSQSYTDVSGLSQSTSENSLNSSGSVDSQPSDSKSIRSWSDKSSATVQPVNRAKVGVKARVGNPSKIAEAAPTKPASRKSSIGDASGSSTPTQAPKIVKKKDNKKSDIVAAVTTRLYTTKKKPDPRLDAARLESEKYDDDDDGELEELKLCKRARMKLFDLSRKLAMTKRVRKMVDSDSQTEFVGGTIRLKEKCIVTDQQGILQFENIATNTPYDSDLKNLQEHPVIMNQVFIPQSSNYIVECGKGVRVEVPGLKPTKCDLGTQTKPERRRKSHSIINYNPITNDDSFSDDSLDSDSNNLGRDNMEMDSLEGYDKPKRGYFYKNTGIKYHSNENLYREVLYIDNPLIRQVMQNKALYRRSFDSLLDSRKSDMLMGRRIEKSSLPIARYPICGTNVLYEYDPNKSMPDKIIYTNFGDNSNLGKESSVPEIIYPQYNPEEVNKQTTETAALPDIQVTLFNGLPLAICTGSVSSSENINDDVMMKTNFLTVNDNVSSENSFNSNVSSDATTSSESSGDFVFYETPKEKEVVKERELYTISENSEHSDKLSSDGSSPHSQLSSLTEGSEGEKLGKKQKDNLDNNSKESEKDSLNPKGNEEKNYSSKSSVEKNALPMGSQEKSSIPKNSENESFKSKSSEEEKSEGNIDENSDPNYKESEKRAANPGNDRGSVQVENREDQPLNMSKNNVEQVREHTRVINENKNPREITVLEAKEAGTTKKIDVNPRNDPNLKDHGGTPVTWEKSEDVIYFEEPLLERSSITPTNPDITNDSFYLNENQSKETKWPIDLLADNAPKSEPSLDIVTNPANPESETDKTPNQSNEPIDLVSNIIEHDTQVPNQKTSFDSVPKPLLRNRNPLLLYGEDKTKTPVLIKVTQSNDKGSPHIQIKRTADKPGKKINWADVQPSVQRQFLNFNILSSSRQSPFSIDILGESKREQSLEATFPSEDSITFVFMGPSNQRTSVLMEIIKRGLGEDSEGGEKRKSRSQGVQCNSKLMRSVSVDTAMIALSKFAKNQMPLSDIARTTSLDTLVPEEMQMILEQGRLHNVTESSCQCNLDGDPSLREEKVKCTCQKPVKYTTFTVTTRDQETETVEEKKESTTQTLKLDIMTTSSSQTSIDVNSVLVPEPENESDLFEDECPELPRKVPVPEKKDHWKELKDMILGTSDQSKTEESSEDSQRSKKAVSWSDDLDVNNEGNWEEPENQNPPNFELGYNPWFRKNPHPYQTEQPLSLDSSSQTRRVRFSEPQRWSLADICQIINEQKDAQTAESMSAFLKEATQLLKNLNEASKIYETKEPLSQSPRKPKTTILIKENDPFKKKAESSAQTEVELVNQKIQTGKDKDKCSDCSSSSENSPTRRQKTLVERRTRKGNLNLTWPRRRPTTLCGKPPTGLKYSVPPRSPRSPLPLRPQSSHSFDLLKSNIDSRINSCSTNWNFSNLSTTFSNSYVGDAYSRPSSSRSVYSDAFKSNDSLACKYWNRSPRPNIPRLDLEIDMEESCRRLESAIEQDRIRQENLSNRISLFNNPKYVPGYWRDESYRSLDTFEEKPELDIQEPRSLTDNFYSNINKNEKQYQTRFRTCKCYCHRFNQNKLKRPYFEFESLGIRSKHCHLCCISCPGEEPKRYYSAPVLNTNYEIENSRCQVSCNGYCPYTAVRIRQPRTSPRIYMQHLLTLRRQIVDASKFAEECVNGR